MQLTDRQKALVRDSFFRAMELHNPWDTRFYDHFFRRAPHLRKLFRDDIAGQEMRFMTTLKVIVDNLEQDGALKPRYAELGREHAAIGVRPQDFSVMEDALMDSLRDLLKDDFTSETEDAWRLLYRQVAGELQESMTQ